MQKVNVTKMLTPMKGERTIFEASWGGADHFLKQVEGGEQFFKFRGGSQLVPHPC